MLPDPGEELFSSLLEDEERTPPDVFSDLSTVLLSTDLRGATGGRDRKEERTKRRKEGGREGEEASKERKQVSETRDFE